MPQPTGVPAARLAVPPLERCRAEWLKRFPDTVWNEPEARSWQGDRDQDDED
jgi:hypothetical protein